MTNSGWFRCKSAKLNLLNSPRCLFGLWGKIRVGLDETKRKCPNIEWTATTGDDLVDLTNNPNHR